MRIGMQTRVAGGTAGNPRQAMILKQIRKLEKERRKLQKELGEAAGAPEGFSAAQPAPANLPAMGQAAPAPDTAAAGEGAKSAAGASATGTSSRSVSAAATAAVNAAVVNAMSGGLDSSGSSGGSSEASAYKRSPEDIMKLIQLVTMQIMTLQEQLGQDATQVMTISADDESDEEPDSVEKMLQMVLPQATELPAPATTAAAVVDGHVDGYA